MRVDAALLYPKPDIRTRIYEYTPRACTHKSVVSASDAARSVLRSEADMRGTLGHVRLGPFADSCSATNSISI
jgi:hypothetical protein